MDFSGCPSDEAFGPTVQGCRDDFDFTIMFEKVFFTLIPTAVFITICIPRAAFLVRKPTVVGGAFLRSVKFLFICIYSILQLTLLVLSIVKARNFKTFFVSSSALAFVSSICMIVISHLEHSRSPRPSNLLNTYLLITTLVDIAQTRTLWLASTSRDDVKFSGVFTSSVFIKAILLVLESQHKSRWVRWNAEEHSPEETSGLFGIGVFFWLNQLFLTGYKKILTLEDLYPLDQSMASERLQVKLAKRTNTLRRPSQKNDLVKALAQALAVPLLLPVGPRIAMTGFQFCQPFLINTLLDYLQKPSRDASRNVGYGLIGATILIYTGIAVSGAVYWYFQERAIYMVRGALASSVYMKTAESKITARDHSAPLTLMSADVERIIRGCLNIHEFWANTIEVGLACWLLSRQIGVASIAPVIVVSCCVVLLSFLGNVTGPRQKVWMEKIQKRVGLTANVVGQMKFLKISGLATPVEESVQAMRLDELKTGSKFRMTIIFSALIGYTPLCISPVMTFAFSSSTLSVTTIFTSISYIILLAKPLSILFQLFPPLLAALACLRRVQAFLEQDGRLEFRRFSTPAADDMIGEILVDERARKPKFAPSIHISDGNFGWDDDKPCLKKINITIPSSALTIVVGPIASGKSTLCKALLGETPVAYGQISMDYRPSRIGYCDQTPYLSNATIRENIVGFAKFDEVRYNEVIEATVLGPDLAILPRGDETLVGSNGVVLSGGQKQRVSIARALYLDSELLIFDDVLSGLDANTEEQLYSRVFSSGGLLRLRRATVVLCTHSVKHLPSADHIIALGPDGSLTEQGSFPDLMAKESYVKNLEIKEADTKPMQASVDIRSLNTITPKSESDSLPIMATQTNTLDIGKQGRMTGDIAVYVHYFSRVNKIIIATVIIFGVGWGFFSNFTTIWLKFWSEDITSARPFHLNSFYIGIYALLQIMTLLSLFSACMVSFRTMIVQSGAILHREALATVIKAPLGFFTTTDTGVVTNLFSQDMTLIDGELPQAFLNVVLQLFECLGMTAVVATSSPFLAITYPFLIAIIYGIQKFYLRTSRQIRLLDLETKSPLYSLFIDTIKGIATFRAFGWTKDSIALNNKYLDASQRPAYLLAMIQRWLGFILQIVVAVLASVVVTLATQLHSNGAFTGASLVTLMNFGSGLSFLVRTYTSLETSIGAISRLKNFGDRVRPESLEGEDLVPPAEWPIRGCIRIDGVSASYVNDHYKQFKRPTDSNSTGAESIHHLALKNLNLAIASKEKVAICGRSGSGKSSIILLLLRLLDPVASCTENIFIDDVPLHKVNRAILRQCIIAVPQEPVFLPDGTSFQANLDPLGTSTEVECRAVLETVNLWDFVHGRGGLVAGMSADTLSGGQRQLFNLARAVLRRRVRFKQLQSELGEKSVEIGGILLLDEVSSSVDQDTDKTMQKIIMEEFKEYTIIMVSHRLDMVSGFDTVIVLDKGSIVESGRPHVMMEADGSQLRNLWTHVHRR